jgi:hypothetical protein
MEAESRSAGLAGFTLSTLRPRDPGRPGSRFYVQQSNPQLPFMHV